MMDAEEHPIQVSVKLPDAAGPKNIKRERYVRRTHAHIRSEGGRNASMMLQRCRIGTAVIIALCSGEPM